MMLDKKQIWAIFLFKFKMGCKTEDNSQHWQCLGPGTANRQTVQWWLKKLCKEDEHLEDEKRSGWPRLTGINWEGHRSWSSSTTWEVAEKLNVDHSMVIQHLKQIGKMKKLEKWVPHELTENQKNCHFEVSSSPVQQQQTISRLVVTCDEKWILWQPATTSSVVVLWRCSKALPKA